MRRIIVTGGGTGGHLFAAIASGEEFHKRGWQVDLITDRRCEKYLPKDLAFASHIIDLKISGGLVNKAIGMLKLIQATIKSLFSLRRIKPNIVIGFGGYPSFPVVLAAVILRVPIAIHEQNCFMGRSNAFFARFARIVAISYPETENIRTNKVVVVGNMVRDSLTKLPAKTYLSLTDSFNILIFGGSQAAKVFSTLLPAALMIVKAEHPEINLKVVQQVVKEDIELLKEQYSKAAIDCELSPFFHNMPELYTKADLGITRAGASTVAELCSAALPAIFIPYPYASDNHQFYNAKALEDAGAGWCFEQKHLTPDILARHIFSLISDPSLLQQASIKLKGRKSDGASLLADTVEKIIE